MEVGNSPEAVLQDRVAKVKNQPPDFKQLIPGAYIKRSLIQSHTETLPRSVYCKQTVPKLIYIVKGLSTGGYYHDDVMPFSSVVLPKLCLSV